MATRDQFKMNEAERRKRIFSEAFKKQIVQEIERKQTTISQVRKAYQVSYNSVSRWIEKYSTISKKGVRLVVEMESETKKMLELQKKVAELERIIGQKQILIDFQDKMIEIAEQTYQIDIKKKSEQTPSSTSGDIEKDSRAV